MGHLREATEGEFTEVIRSEEGLNVENELMDCL